MNFNFLVSVRNLLRSTSFWKDYHFVLQPLKYFRLAATLALTFSILAATFEGVGLGFLLSFLQSLTDPKAAVLKTGMEWFDIWFLGVYEPPSNRLYRISGLILVSTWIRCSFSYYSQLYTQLVQYNLIDNLRKRGFEQLQALSLSYYAKVRAGELINLISVETNRLQYVFGSLALFVTRGSTLIAYILIMLFLSWQLTLVSVALFSLLAVGMSSLNAKARENSFGVSEVNGRLTTTLVEFINGIRTVQACVTQDFERKRFYQASSDFVDVNMRVAKAISMVRPIGEVATTTILIGMIIVGTTGAITGQALQSASLLTFLFALFRLTPILQDLNYGRTQISSFYGALVKTKEFLRTDDKIYLKNGTIQFLGLEDAIKLVDVDFGYDPDVPVLKGITLTINKGEMTALVGSSGAGKTTLADLIPRFYEPIQGNIFVDSIDIKEFDVASLRRKIAVVSQDTFIFNASVRNNIAYGVMNLDELAIREAAQMANALEFIEEMPEGLETLLGDRGVRLSGGQRQRIAIARALLRNPDILILDEATSALDSVTEKLIQDSLEKLSQGRTVIAIAHRLSTIVKADKVVVLEHGQIVEQGNYQELLEKKGKLWEYHQVQYSFEST